MQRVQFQSTKQIFFNRGSEKFLCTTTFHAIIHSTLSQLAKSTLLTSFQRYQKKSQVSTFSFTKPPWLSCSYFITVYIDAVIHLFTSTKLSRFNYKTSVEHTLSETFLNAAKFQKLQQAPGVSFAFPFAGTMFSGNCVKNIQVRKKPEVTFS